MSGSLDSLAARKSLLLSRSSLLRMQLALGVTEVRAAMRPRALVSGLFSRPGTVLSLLGFVTPLLKLRRLTRWLRVSRRGFSLFGFLKNRLFRRG